MKDKSPVLHSHEYYVDLVQRSPKIPRNEWTPEEIESKGHLQFGNNFYCLFLGRLRAEKAPDPLAYRSGSMDMLPSFDLKKVETKYPEQWARFLANNSNLIKQIDKALDGNSVYSECLHHYRDLILESRETNDFTKVDAYEALDVESLGVYAWRQLNPLLEEAAAKMSDEGINPKELFG